MDQRSLPILKNYWRRNNGLQTRVYCIVDPYGEGVIPVTRFAKKAKQPPGGYLNPRELTETVFDDGLELNPVEDLPPTIIGLAVDYLTRFMLDGDAAAAFRVSFRGAQLYGEENIAYNLIRQIEGLDAVSIEAACFLVAYDTVARVGPNLYKRYHNPDKVTTLNIRIMVERSVAFFEKHGPIQLYGLSFSPLNQFKVHGDCDIITADTLWEMKVSKYPPTQEHTMQLLLYYHLMFVQYESLALKIKNIGIFNPRLNTAYTYNMEKFEQEYTFTFMHYVV